jgi:vacuolar-type H+-ATPase subunit I/STV1
MKRFFLFLTVMTLGATLNGSAQDVAALEERVKQLNGYVQDLLEDKTHQKKQIEALAKEIQALREQQQTQPKTSYASQEDLRALAKQVQDIEDKRKTDREVILKEIENLGKASAGKPRPPKNNSGNSTPGDLPDKAIEHTIAAGDTLSTIAAAYSKEKGVKITTEQIRKANPGIKDDKLAPGKKILVPVPEK